MGSTRLPGKVMMDLGGDTVLARVIHRVRRCQLAGEIVVATTKNGSDEVIVSECRRLGVDCFRGEETDVLDRYYRAALACGAEVIVRICADSPMIEPEISDLVIRGFLDQQTDYASNTLTKTYPAGLDTEVFTVDALEEAWGEAKSTYQRSHVTPHIYENPRWFDILHVTGPTDYSHYRWTLDTADDMTFMRAVYGRFGNRDEFYWRDVIALLECEPDIAELNCHVRAKALHEG